MLVSVNSQTNSLRPEPAVAQPVSQTDRAREAAPAVVETKPEPAPALAPSPAQIATAASEINQALKMAAIGVQFEFDKEANTMIAKVVDNETGEVIRQMPSADVVRMSRALGELQGLLVSRKV